MSNTTGDELVVIAKVAKPRGLKGEVAAELLTDFPDRFDGLVDVIGIMPDGTPREFKIERFFFHKGRIVLKFAGFDTVESGEELRDVDVCVREAEIVTLETDEFFDWQLEGCSVETVDGTDIGKVRVLMRTGGTEVLVIDGTQKEYLIPFAESICVGVDVENKKIRINPPDGLLEF